MGGIEDCDKVHPDEVVLSPAEQRTFAELALKGQGDATESESVLDGSPPRRGVERAARPPSRGMVQLQPLLQIRGAAVSRDVEWEARPLSATCVVAGEADGTAKLLGAAASPPATNSAVIAAAISCLRIITAPACESPRWISMSFLTTVGRRDGRREYSNVRKGCARVQDGRGSWPRKETGGPTCFSR